METPAFHIKMKQLQHVIWSKGTFLTPQHLQLQDRYIEDTLRFFLESLSFRFWGFSRLQVDENKLVDGLFSLSSGAGVLPDGLLFDFPSADAAPPSRQVNSYFSEQRRKVGIYLSVPEQRPGGANISHQTDIKTRYVAETRMLRDENSGSSEKPIQVARKNLRLLMDSESREGSTVMQVAEIEQTPEGTYRLVPGYVPPTIDVHGNPVLLGILRSLVERLAARSSVLADARKQKNQTLADFTAADVASFWLLYTVNSHLPVFRHLFNCSMAHPEQIYFAMLELAGALTTFSLTIQSRDLPNYDHENLGACFSDLDKKVRLLLEEVVPTNFVSIPLKFVRDSTYAAAIDEDKYLQDTKVYLAVSAEISDADLITRVPQLMKIGAAGYVDDIVRHAMPGIRLTHVVTPPSEIPVKLKYKYFSLDTQGSVWEGIKRGRNVGVHAPGEFRNVELELVILLPVKR
jgi:type VI secretion system protein ImpJ